MAKNFSHAFTLIELLVVIAVIAILIAIAYPAYTGVQERARVTQDMNNLRQLGLAMQTYLNDNDDVLPVINASPGTGTTAIPVIYPKYISTRKVFQSPFDRRSASETDTAPVSYGINANVYLAGGLNRNMARVVSPASTILMAPTYIGGTGDPKNAASWTGIATNVPNLPVGGAGEATGTHSNGTQINALFCDSHAENMNFGPATVLGSFKDFNSNPLGRKHWDPTF
jgi:prepilin-type N-terminal cleavage/methylation domain-containing protein/prepilin-type processing-associated H-X9-DG protein